MSNSTNNKHVGFTSIVQHIGSLERKVSQLENIIENEHPNNNTDQQRINSNFIKTLENKQRQQVSNEKSKTLQSIYTSYKLYLSDILDDPLGNFIEIIKHTVIWVEKNSHIIFKLIDIVLCGDNKLDLALSLLSDVINIDNIEFVKDIINSIVKLIFPHKKDKREIKKLKKLAKTPTKKLNLNEKKSIREKYFSLKIR